MQVKDSDTLVGMISSATIGAVVYPNADDLLKLLIPLIAGALAPTIKDLLGDCRDYFREKILKLKKDDTKKEDIEQQETELLKKTLNDLKPNENDKI